MINEEIRKFEELTGKNANDFSIAYVGGFLDGYDKGKAEAPALDPKGDLISREALINAFNEAQVEFDEYYKGLGKAKVITDNAPTVPTYSQKLGCEICVNRNIKSKEACTSLFGLCEFFKEAADNDSK